VELGRFDDGSTLGTSEARPLPKPHRLTCAPLQEEKVEKRVEEVENFDLTQEELIIKVLRLAKEQSQTQMAALTSRFEARDKEAGAEISEQSGQIRELHLLLASEQARSKAGAERLAACEVRMEDMQGTIGAGEKALTGLKEHKR